MKAMIVVLSPRESRDLLNGDLSVLVRKKFPKDYVGWVYIYCTKGGKYLFKDIYAEKNGEGKLYYVDDKEHDSWSQQLNGKVVAKFLCDKVEKLIDRDTKEKNHYSLGTETLQIDELEKMSCLTIQELVKYIGKGTEWRKGKYGYAIHITKVEPFDKPKEINEFIICRERKHKCKQKFSDYPCKKCVSMNLLTRAPRNGWCYMEV